MFRTPLIALLLTVGAWAQPGLNRFPGDLREYLALTAPQVASIERLNGDFMRFNVEKTRRAVQVQREIREETARTALDPMALGLRYVELEAIRRELESERNKTAEEIRKLLTPAQSAKLQALVEALKLYGPACDAVAQGLIELPQAAAPRPEPAFPGNVIGVLLPRMPACGGAGGAAFRTGDFLPAP